MYHVISKYTSPQILPASNRSNHDKRLLAGSHCFRQRSIRGIMGHIFLTRKEAQESAALFCVMVANGSAQHRITGFKRIKHRALGDWAFYRKCHLGIGMCQRSQVKRKNDADHIKTLATI